MAEDDRAADLARLRNTVYVTARGHVQHLWADCARIGAVKPEPWFLDDAIEARLPVCKRCLARQRARRVG